MITILVLIAIVGLVLVLLGSSVRIVTQYERGVVFRFGRVPPQPAGPGSRCSRRSPTGCEGQHADHHPCRSPPRTASPATT